jgi:hypothetical protein
MVRDFFGVLCITNLNKAQQNGKFGIFSTAYYVFKTIENIKKPVKTHKDMITGLVPKGGLEPP